MNNTALTFVEDDAAPATGVDVSTAYAMRQSIYANQTYTAAMLQVINTPTLEYTAVTYEYPLAISIVDASNAIIAKVYLHGEISPTTNQNFKLFSGDSLIIEVDVTNGGSVVNLTGATIKWGLRQRSANAMPEVSKDTTDGITITDPTGGVFQISLVPGDTSSLSGYYYHEAEVTDALGNASTIMTGTVEIVRSGV